LTRNKSESLSQFSSHIYYSGRIESHGSEQALKGIKVVPSAPVVSHLLFADDNLLFFKEDRKNAQEAIDVLNTYCQALGQ
jgi:hypothetical protein